MSMPLSCQLLELHFNEIGMLLLSKEKFQEFHGPTPEIPLLECSFAFDEKDSEHRVYRVWLQVRHAVNNKKGECFSGFFAKTEGCFRWREAILDNRIAGSAIVNAANILYGAIRDRFMLLSGSSLFVDTVLLPTVMMSDLVGANFSKVTVFKDEKGGEDDTHSSPPIHHEKSV